MALIASFFKKQPSLDGMRQRRIELAAKLHAAKQEIVDQQDRITALHIENAEPALITKAKATQANAERDVAGLASAINVLDQQIEIEAAAIAAAEDRQDREKFVAELDDHAKMISAATATVIEGLEALVAATGGTVAKAIPDARGLNLLAGQLSKEIPQCAAAIAAMIGAHTKAVLNGSATVRRVSPDLVVPRPKAPPISKTAVLSLDALTWREADTIMTAARYQQIEVPVELATKAIYLRWAIPMTDPRWSQFYCGYTASPSPSVCVNLDDPNLKPRLLAMGADRARVASGMQVVLGGSNKFSERPS